MQQIVELFQGAMMLFPQSKAATQNLAQTPSKVLFLRATFEPFKASKF
jgi:hypothetical protein